MAHVLRPLIHWTRWRHHHSTFSHLLSLHCSSTRAAASRPLFAFFSCRELQSGSRALKLHGVPLSPEFNEIDDEVSDSGGAKKSRNERKRDARRAVRWGMELASFSPPQIKRILRVADLQQEVFDALMLVKRLGREVREGKRRQFNYIGRLLREVDPELMDDLIQATKDGDQSKFQDLSGPELLVVDEEEEGDEEISEENDEEDSMDTAVVTRWYNGLINKDITITNEIYSLREVEFDRQELRQLVRKLQNTAARESSSAENGKADAAAVNARRSLTRFLQGLAEQLPDE